MHLLYYHVRAAVTINSTPFYQLDAVEHLRKTVLMVSVENLMSIKFFYGKEVRNKRVTIYGHFINAKILN